MMSKFCTGICAVLILGALARDAWGAIPGKSVIAPNVQAAEQAMSALKQRNPERYQKIVSTRERDPNLFSKLVLQVMREESRLAFLKKNFPENYGLQQTMWSNREKLGGLLKEYQSDASTTNRTLVEQQISRILGEQFDLRNQMRRNRMKRYEARLAKMKQTLQDPTQSDRNVFVESWKSKLLAKSPQAAE